MNWRSKARLAKAISKLPSGLSYSAYYLVQRHFGALRSANPDHRVKAGVAMVDFIRKHREELRGSETFLEVGTGRCLSLPISLWLCGAYQTITVDLNPYLKSELVFEEIEYIRNQQQRVIQMFGEHNQKPQFRERLNLLLNFKGGLKDLLALINIRYITRADAAHLDLPGESVDYHVSFGVIEHIARGALNGIFLEANRLLKDTGLAIHYATLADLFSTIDDSISPVNFLQFSENEWESIAGNRYMYHNRFRVDDLRQLFEQTKFRVLDLQSKVHPESLRLIQTGTLPLDRRFREKSPETNASQEAWVIAAPC